MADRMLSVHEEARNPEGPHWKIRADRSASGQPGVLFTIEFDSFDGTLPHLEMTVVVEDANEFLAPVLTWLASKRGAPVPSDYEASTIGKMIPMAPAIVEFDDEFLRLTTPDGRVQNIPSYMVGWGPEGVVERVRRRITIITSPIEVVEEVSRIERPGTVEL